MPSLRERTVFASKGLTVTVVESLEFRAAIMNRRGFTTVDLEPIAVIVQQPDKTYALNMAGQPVDIDRLELPGGFDSGRGVPEST